MAKSRSAASTADEIDAIEELMSDLETRLRRLQASVRQEGSDASGDVSAFVTETLNDIATRVRDGARVTGEAAKLGSDTLKWVTEEIEEHPFVVLAVAAGVGFVLGMLQRR